MKFFHRMKHYHKRKNNLDRIKKIEGVWVKGDEAIRSGIVDAFKKLLIIKKANLDGLNFFKMVDLTVRFL